MADSRVQRKAEIEQWGCPKVVFVPSESSFFVILQYFCCFLVVPGILFAKLKTMEGRCAIQSRDSEDR